MNDVFLSDALLFDEKSLLSNSIYASSDDQCSPDCGDCMGGGDD